jgi:cyclopropane fatty-acyl-phospholipid synthase-like methyltransferase
VLARYKFAAKMLAGQESTLEVGCGDAFGLPLVRQTVERVHAVDFEPIVVDAARDRFTAEGHQPVTFSVHDITAGPVDGRFSSAYSLDVIEHIPQSDEAAYLDNIVASLEDDGVLLLGTPNVTAEQYASPLSREGHINLKSHAELRDLVAQRFTNVFMFG